MKEPLASILEEGYSSQLGERLPKWYSKVMAERDGFSTFLISAAVAGLSIGGTWTLSEATTSRNDARELAVLTTKVEAMSTDLRRLVEGLSTVIVLNVRVDNVEKALDRQQRALEAMRSGRVPEDMLNSPRISK